MRWLFFEHVMTAVRSLRSTPARTMLTILGVAIGVTGITAILSLSSGLSSVIDSQVDDLGGNVAVVLPSQDRYQLESLTGHNFTTSTLSEDDYRDVADLPDVVAAAPIMTIRGTIKSKSATLAGSTIMATTPDFAKIADLKVNDGQFLDEMTNRETAVLGRQLAIDLFGTNLPIGWTFKVQGQTFTVIGVLEQQNRPVNFNNVDLDRAAIINLESGKSFHQGIAQLQQIDLQAKDASLLPTVAKAAEEVITRNHHGEKDFEIVYGNSVARPTNELFQTITTVLMAIAAISLVVGGVGIMNIMLVGVAERTHEIGLRKAVGASNFNIVSQFLTESLIISLLGSIAGYIAGYLTAFAIASFLPFWPAFTWQTAGAALGIALIIGLIFGFYPALRAARKNPIESLREIR